MASSRVEENQIRRPWDKGECSALSVSTLIFLLLLTKILLNVSEGFSSKLPANTENFLNIIIPAVGIFGGLTTAYFIKSSIADQDATIDSSRLRLFSPAANQNIEPIQPQLIGNTRGK